MAEHIFLCNNCGTKNRIPAGKTTGMPICGYCSKALAIKENNRSFLSTLFAIIINLWFVWFVVILFIVIPYFEDKDHKGSKKSKMHPTSITEMGSFSEPIVQINHGIIEKNFVSGVAPLEIKTQKENNYYIKIINVFNKQVVLTAYIVGGYPFEVEMPLGEYEILYATGNAWYGTQHYFGPHTVFSKANEVFDFTFDGYSYSGYTVELILQAYGNLRTTNIDKSSF